METKPKPLLPIFIVCYDQDTVAGPDVLTMCGQSGRRLNIGETYLTGVGGACSPWSTSESYSTDELNMLRGFCVTDQSLLCGALISVPSLLTILLSVLLIRWWWLLELYRDNATKTY